MTYNLATGNIATQQQEQHQIQQQQQKKKKQGFIMIMKKKRRIYTNICLLSIGTLLISIGISIFVYFEAIYDYLMNSAMSFNPHSEPYRVWRINDPPLVMNVYMFNWTNPKDIYRHDIKPKFEEIGPYRFLEIKEKMNITWHDNNTISYKHKKTYYFDEENSVRKLDDIITTINIVPLAIAYKAKHFGYFSKRTISYTLSSLSTLSVTKTVGELLFDGYEESILSILSSLPLAGVKDRFGLFYGKNDTFGDDGIYSMWTKNDEKFGTVVSWNYRNQSDFFKDHCNDIRGSAGEFYPINRKRDYLELYSSELCRIARLEYEKDVEIKGVKGYKYTGRNLFDNGTLVKENACYCADECLPSGILNVSTCRDNSPTFLSMPHFYGADPYYINSIEGVHPNENHEFFITLEPKSGIVIDLAARMQVNMLLQPVPQITMYENVPKIIIPIFYFTQSITLKDDLAPTLVLIQKLPEINNIASLIMICLGILAYAWIFLDMCWCNNNKNGNNNKNNKIKFNSNKNDEKIPHQSTYEEIPLRSFHS